MRIISKIEKETKYWSVQKNFYFASLRVIRRGGTAGEEIPFFGEPPFCQILLRCNGSSKATISPLLFYSR
jgi:hypothetical protein